MNNLKENIKFNKLSKIFCFFILFLFLNIIFSCSENQLNEYSFDFIKFSTLLNIKIISNNSKNKIYSDIEEVLRKTEIIADMLDFYKADSLLNCLNINGKIEKKDIIDFLKNHKNNFILINDEFDIDFINEKVSNIFYFFNRNIDYFIKTNGYFNPLIGKLTLLYNNFEKGSKVPSYEELKEEINNIKNSRFLIENEKLIKEGKSILNFGGSLKGFLIDIIYKDLINKNYENFLINCGGDIRVSSDGKKNWKIGIKDPFNKENIFAILNIKNISVVTSGDYERFFEYNNKKYFHIINPFTGYPDSDLSSVTIICNECLDADILSTAIFAMGKEKGIEFIEKNKIEALLIWKENNKVKYFNSIKNIKILFNN